MGWAWPEWISLHGPLMVGGFLGTLIALERAVGLEKKWGYLQHISTFQGLKIFLFFGISVVLVFFIYSQYISNP